MDNNHNSENNRAMTQCCIFKIMSEGTSEKA